MSVTLLFAYYKQDVQPK